MEDWVCRLRNSQSGGDISRRVDGVIHQRSLDNFLRHLSDEADEACSLVMSRSACCLYRRRQSPNPNPDRGVAPDQ